MVPQIMARMSHPGRIEFGSNVTISIDAGFKSGRHNGPKLIALVNKLITEISFKYKRRLNEFPFEPQQDSFNTGFCALTVQSSPYEEGNRLAFGFTETRIVYPFKKILDCSAHVSEILGGSDNHAIRP